MATNRVLTEAEIHVMKDAASYGCTQEEIAHMLRMAPSTFWSILKRDPNVNELYLQAASGLKAKLRKKLVDRALSDDSRADAIRIYLGKVMLNWVEPKQAEIIVKAEGFTEEALIETTFKRLIDVPQYRDLFGRWLGVKNRDCVKN